VKADTTQILLRPLITEKAVDDSTHRSTYHFEVARHANKAMIKQAVEEMFNVRVADVRTATRRGKPRRVRFKRGHTRVWKKAVVTLVPGDSIELI